MTRTALMWSPQFATHPAAPASGFVAPSQLLPDDPWDVGARVWHPYDLLRRAGILQELLTPSFAPAQDEDLLRFHTRDYVEAVKRRSGQGFDDHAAGALAVGAALALVEAVDEGKVDNGYALVRPAGHHAEAGDGGRACVYNSVVLAVLAFLERGARRVLVLDIDAHHGNGAQRAFECDDQVLTISIHQAQGDPDGPGGLGARGLGRGFGLNINVPLPAGSGGGAYRAAFEQVVHPAVQRFRPNAVVVASGLDATNLDPSARLRLHSQDYAWIVGEILALAGRSAEGRLVMIHEGGYAIPYLGLCLAAIVQALAGLPQALDDPFLARWGPDFAAVVSAEAERSIVAATRHAQQVPEASTEGHPSRA